MMMVFLNYLDNFEWYGLFYGLEYLIVVLVDCVVFVINRDGLCLCCKWCVWFWGYIVWVDWL